MVQQCVHTQITTGTAVNLDLCIHADEFDLQTRAYKSLNLDHGEKCILFPFPGSLEYKQGTDLALELPYRYRRRTKFSTPLCNRTSVYAKVPLLI